MAAPAVTALVLAALHMNAASVYACMETGGAIVEAPDGTLHNAYADIDESSGHDLRMFVEIPRGRKLVAIWHTHPQCEPGINDALFSDGDIKMQRALHVPSYIFVQADWSVRVYENGRARVVQMGFRP